MASDAASSSLAPPPSPAPARPRQLAVPRPASKQKRDSSVFRPRLPLDPFASAAHHEPLLLPAERLANASAHTPRRDVLLVLGDPSPADLTPLIRSDRLALSLLIIATHNPAALSPLLRLQNPSPAVRLLALSSPLDLEHAGALRLVNVLEWAERVARAWRRSPSPGTQTLSEDGLGTLTPPSLFGGRGAKIKAKSSPSSPAASAESIPSSNSLPEHPNGSTSTLGRLLRKRVSSYTMPPPDPSQRPFDALLHFLPQGLPDKSLLKQSILVTTISRPFLVAAAPPLPAMPASERRRSFFGRNSVHSLYSLPPTPPLSSRDSLVGLSVEQLPEAAPIKSRLLHLLPTTKTAPRLIESIESFLLSFSFPASRPSLAALSASPSMLSSSLPHSPSSRPLSTASSMSVFSDAGSSFSGGGGGLEPARTFLLPGSALAHPVAAPPHLQGWTLADVVLSGVLDASTGEPRAFLAGAHDVRVVSAPSSPGREVTMPTLSPPPPAVRRMSDTPPSAYAPSTKAVRRLTQSVGPGARPFASQLPTPPDSEEDGLSGSTAGSGSASASSRSTEKTNAKAHRSGVKERRWMFWKRVSTR
ncbi:hypothetical protein FA95DRAFT_1569509 [Auriscalpium vulgare]|uniref:Uncharacterized protein n=1 Tax=Auriscalpium vulgare TaxID=40419 RepID=A0ACB8S702_9AGAM|nr:hypothetical protein FA95DRAFT_1569509 [Auriscalpium vulgare]